MLALTMRSMTVLCVLCLGVTFARSDDMPDSTDPKYLELRGELLQRNAADRTVRTSFIKWIKTHGSNALSERERLRESERDELDHLLATMQDTDHENTQWLKTVVQQYGWPTRTMVGKKGANAAWVLVQHADAEPQFQRQCLDLMTKLPKEEVSQQDFGRLTDRVLIAEGKKQIYGTFHHIVDGKLLPFPIEDEANVEKRRVNLGFPPLSEELKGLQKTYGVDPK